MLALSETLVAFLLDGTLRWEATKATGHVRRVTEAYRGKTSQAS